MEIDVVTNDDVPIGITNQEAVTKHFSLTGTARRGYAHVRAPLSKQSVHPEAQCDQLKAIREKHRDVMLFRFHMLITILYTQPVPPPGSRPKGSGHKHEQQQITVVTAAS